MGSLSGRRAPGRLCTLPPTDKLQLSLTDFVAPGGAPLSFMVMTKKAAPVEGRLMHGSALWRRRRWQVQQQEVPSGLPVQHRPETAISKEWKEAEVNGEIP